MNAGIVSVRYARALLKFAIEKSEEDCVYTDMATIRNVFIKHPKIRTVIINPILSEAQLTTLLNAISGPSASASTKRFLKVLTKRKRIELLPFIANSYIEQYRQHKHITICELTIPMKDISDELKERIQKFVENDTGNSVNIEIKTDAGIGGGFVLEYGTYRIDASLKNRLRSIKEHLSKSYI